MNSAFSVDKSARKPYICSMLYQTYVFVSMLALLHKCRVCAQLDEKCRLMNLIRVNSTPPCRVFLAARCNHKEVPIDTMYRMLIIHEVSDLFCTYNIYRGIRVPWLTTHNVIVALQDEFEFLQSIHRNFLTAGGPQVAPIPFHLGTLLHREKTLRTVNH